ncbi:MAG TPA: DUF2600 family protein [Syntrophales bacterium]|nr:DUF2600 family protein [Syntrophales bacterium]
MHPEQEDGGYLICLMETCRKALQALPQCPLVALAFHEFADHYCQPQIDKHVRKDEREARLKKPL